MARWNVVRNGDSVESGEAQRLWRTAG